MKRLSITACLLSAMLLGCPSESDSTTDDAATGTTGAQPTTSVQNDPLPEGQSEPTVPDSTEENEAEESEPTSGEQSTDVSLLELDWDSVLALAANHSGKVVVVDLWSLSCEPCRIEFPNLVKLARQYPDDVVCISVATDYQGLPRRPLTYYRPKVIEFLQAQDAQFENVLCTTPKPDLFQALELGSEPAIFVFNQSGEQAALFTGLQEGDVEVSYERHVIPFVEGLLAGG